MEKEKTINEVATGREEVQDPKQQIKRLLEGNRKLAHVEIQEILKKYDCQLSATMTITPSGNYPSVVIVNNQTTE